MDERYTMKNGELLTNLKEAQSIIYKMEDLASQLKSAQMAQGIFLFLRGRIRSFHPKRILFFVSILYFINVYFATKNNYNNQLDAIISEQTYEALLQEVANPDVAYEAEAIDTNALWLNAIVSTLPICTIFYSIVAALLLLRSKHISNRSKRRWNRWKDSYTASGIPVGQLIEEGAKVQEMFQRNFLDVWYPKDYVYPDAIDHFVSYVENGEATNIREMITCYKRDKHNEQMQETANDMLEKLRNIDSKLSNIQRSAAAAANAQAQTARSAQKVEDYLFND